MLDCPVSEAAGGAQAPLATGGSRRFEQAKKLAAGGIAVFPCNPNKKPLVKAWGENASTDAKQIEEWWTQFPMATVGVPMGKASTLLLPGPRHQQRDRRGGRRDLAEQQGRVRR